MLRHVSGQQTIFSIFLKFSSTNSQLFTDRDTEQGTDGAQEEGRPPSGEDVASVGFHINIEPTQVHRYGDDFRQVAELLKRGQSVEPEGFDSVTVFFCDVVKFTQLAAKCLPLQVRVQNL